MHLPNTLYLALYDSIMCLCFNIFFFIDLQLKLQSLNSKKKSDEPLRCFDKLYCSIQVQVTQCPKVKFNKHSLHIELHSCLDK